MPTASPGMVPGAASICRLSGSAPLRGLQVEAGAFLTSMAGTSFSRPGCENIDLILAATGMGDSMCISKTCLGCSPWVRSCALAPWLHAHPSHLHSPAHMYAKGSSQMGRAAGLRMCCLCDWGEITGQNFKYWPVNLSSFQEEQSGETQAGNHRVPPGRCWPAVWLRGGINAFAGS